MYHKPQSEQAAIFVHQYVYIPDSFCDTIIIWLEKNINSDYKE